MFFEYLILVSFIQGKIVCGQNQSVDWDGSILTGYITTDSINKLFYEYGKPDKTAQQKQFTILNILETFPRLLLHYEESIEMVSQFIQITTDLNAKTSLYLDANGTYNRKKEIWISFYPENGVSTIAQQILKMATESNKMYPFTVTNVLLDYQGLRLTPVTLPLIKHEIFTASRIFKTDGVLSFGVILDLANCEQSTNRIKDLPMDIIDLVVFKVSKVPQLSDQGYLSALILLQEKYINCNKRVVSHLNETGTSLGFVSKWALTVKENESVGLELANAGFLGSISKWRIPNKVVLILDAFFLNKPSRNKTTTTKGKQGKNKQLVDEMWLRSSAVFSHKYFGITVNPSNLAIFEMLDINKVVATIYQSFRKVLVSNVLSSNMKDFLNLQNVVIQVAKYKTKIVREQGSDFSEDQIPMQVYIATYVSYENLKGSTASIDNVISVAKMANNEYPETVATILINCFAYQVEIFIANDTKSAWHNYISPTIKYAKAMATPNQLSVGIILPERFCNLFTSDDQSTNLELIDLLIFQQDISLEEIQNGTKSVINKLNVVFGNCKTRAEQVWQTKYKRDIQVAYQVNLISCQTGNYTKLEDMINFVNFWEEMNSWAQRERSEVLVQTGFDNPAQNEFCGWWKMGKERLTGKPVLENKKMAALKTYNSASRSSRFRSREKVNLTAILLYTLLPTIVFVVLLTGTSAYLVMRYRAKYIMSRKEAEEFFKGSEPIDVADSDSKFKEITDGNLNAHSKPYEKDRYELDKNLFTIDLNNLLGSGEYGIVCKGTVKKESGVAVNAAVKMVNSSKGKSIHGSSAALRGLLSEIKVLSYVGKHKNIIELIGAYTKELRTGKVYVFLELCEFGSLEKYLRQLESYKVDEQQAESERYVNLVKRKSLDELLLKDLIQWSLEICDGMEALAAKNVIHADLATRNILLDSRKQAKIADFGLSRRLYDYTNYVKQNQEPLPWRWMAPESLKRLEFSEKTDVWSFGVTLYEIYTLGDLPYPGLSWNSDFITQLENGLRLANPIFSPEGIYEIMHSCWRLDSNRRPTFLELNVALQQIWIRCLN